MSSAAYTVPPRWKVALDMLRERLAILAAPWAVEESIYRNHKGDT